MVGAVLTLAQEDVLQDQIDIFDGARTPAGEDHVTATWLEESGPYITLQLDAGDDDEDADLD